MAFDRFLMVSMADAGSSQHLRLFTWRTGSIRWFFCGYTRYISRLTGLYFL